MKVYPEVKKQNYRKYLKYILINNQVINMAGEIEIKEP